MYALSMAPDLFKSWPFPLFPSIPHDWFCWLESNWGAENCSIWGKHHLGFFYSRNSCRWYWRIFSKPGMWMILAKSILETRTWTGKRLNRLRESSWAWCCPEKVIKFWKITVCHSDWKRRLGWREMLSSIWCLGRRPYTQSKFWICRLGLEYWNATGHKVETKLPRLVSVAEDTHWHEGGRSGEEKQGPAGDPKISRWESRHAKCIGNPDDKWWGGREAESDRKCLCSRNSVQTRHASLRGQNPRTQTEKTQQQDYNNTINDHMSKHE